MVLQQEIQEHWALYWNETVSHGISHLCQLNAFEYRDIMKQAVVCFKGECSPSKPYIISYNVTWCHMMLLCRFVWRSGSHCWQSYHQSVSDVHRVVHDAPSRWTWRWIPSKTRSNWENTHPGHEDFWTCIWAPLKRITWRCVTLHNVTWFIFFWFVWQCTKVKFHMVLHYPESIRRFGVARNFIAENFEMAHKPTKAAARRTNFQVTLYNTT